MKLKMIRISVTLTKDQSISLPAGLEVVCPVKEGGSVFAEFPILSDGTSVSGMNTSAEGAITCAGT